MDINDRLQKADKLIRRQRITIAVMVVAFLVVGIYTCYTLSLWKARVQDFDDYMNSTQSLFTAMNHQIGDTSSRVWKMQEKAQRDAQVIRNLDRQLHQYEMRFGSLPRAGKAPKSKD
jgi:sensor domain CHASE-containing protein